MTPSLFMPSNNQRAWGSNRPSHSAGRLTLWLLPVLACATPHALAETASATSGLTLVDTRAIDLRSPVGAAFLGDPVVITFHLPRQAIPGSVKLHFDGNASRILTLAGVHEAAGDHSVTFPPANPAASDSILSGESIPEGLYTLTMSYQEGAGNPAPSNAAAGITLDQTLPALSVPSELTVPATTPAGAVVTYPAAIASDANGIASLTYSMASGAFFPIGHTTVTVTAVDRAGNVSTATFRITVEGIQIRVEQPAGNVLTHNSPLPVDFGPVVAGGSGTLPFLIRNAGTGELTGLALSLAPGGSAADFSFEALADNTLLPAATRPFSLTFSPGGPGPRTAKLLIASNDPDENPFEVNLTGRLATPLETWRHTYFGSTANTGAGADLNDAEADGLVNLLEYATAADPVKPSPSPLEFSMDGDGLHLTYSRPAAGPDELSYAVETSASLTGGWSPEVNAVTEILSSNAGVQRVRTTLPADSEPRRFLRLRVTRL
jgi:hypothetical protein